MHPDESLFQRMKIATRPSLLPSQDNLIGATNGAQSVREGKNLSQVGSLTGVRRRTANALGPFPLLRLGAKPASPGQ